LFGLQPNKIAIPTIEYYRSDSEIVRTQEQAELRAQGAQELFEAERIDAYSISFEEKCFLEVTRRTISSKGDRMASVGMETLVVHFARDVFTIHYRLGLLRQHVLDMLDHVYMLHNPGWKLFLEQPNVRTQQHITLATDK
jgi:hypothetical protein